MSNDGNIDSLLYCNAMYQVLYTFLSCIYVCLYSDFLGSGGQVFGSLITGAKPAKVFETPSLKH